MRRWSIVGAVTAVLAVLLYLLLGSGPSRLTAASADRERPGPRAGNRASASSSGEPSGHAPGASDDSTAPSEPVTAGPDTEDEADAPGTLSLWGSVTDANGQPLEGVSVEARADGDVKARGTTDAQGQFRLRSLPPGAYDVSFSRERFLDEDLPEHPLGPDSAPLAVTLQPAPSIEGRVVDTGGNPVPGAVVELLWIPEQEEPPAHASHSAFVLEPPDVPPPPPSRIIRGGTTSALDGTFVLDPPEPGVWFVQAQAEGFAPISREITAPARDVWLVLGAGTSVEVQVTDDQDRPVPHAPVELWTEEETSESPPPLRAVADEAGRAVLRGLLAGQYVLAATSPPETRFRLVTQALVLRGEETRRVRLRFEEGQGLSGTVVDRAGRPLAEVEVRVLPRMQGQEPAGAHLHRFASRLRDEWTGIHGVLRTGSDGRFTVRHLLPLVYMVSFEKPGYILDAHPQLDNLYLGEEHGLSVPAGTSELRVVLRYQGLVSGRVVRADGEPVPEFRIDGTPHSHPDGTFTVEAGSPGPHTLKVLVPGVGGVRREYEAREDEDVDLGDLVVGEGRPVRVAVVDAMTSQPLARVKLEVREAGEDRKLSRAELGLEKALRTDDQGTFLLPDVPARDVQLAASAKGYEDGRVPLGPDTREVTVRLRPWATVRGQVRVGGAPMLQGEVEFFTSDGERVEDLEVKEGQFSGHLLPPARYIVHVDCDDCPEPPPVFPPRWVDVPGPLETLTLDFEDARSGATVEIQGFEALRQLLFVAGPSPVPLDSDQFHAAWRLSLPMDELDNDFYRLRYVPAGRYTLLGRYMRGEDEVFLRQEVEVPAEGVVRLQLQPR